MAYSYQEELELAALAAGIDGVYTDSFYDLDSPVTNGIKYDCNGMRWIWNPLELDADAFQLMTYLSINVSFNCGLVIDEVRADNGMSDDYHVEPFATNEQSSAAVRRAIVSAAAEVGQSMVDSERA